MRMDGPASEDEYPDGKSELLHAAWAGYKQMFWVLFILGVLYLGLVFTGSL
jgi:hypothetical protein